jgi:hypothetical protein
LRTTDVTAKHRKALLLTRPDRVASTIPSKESRALVDFWILSLTANRVTARRLDLFGPFGVGDSGGLF